MAEPGNPTKDGVDKLVDKFRAGLDISAQDLASCPSDTFVRPSEETYKRRILFLFMSTYCRNETFRSESAFTPSSSFLSSPPKSLRE
jgi:hypothetical protein